MPELPEVEVVRRGLEKAIAGQPEILSFQFFRKDLRDPMPVRKLSALAGGHLLGIERRAKYLIFRSSKGDFISHLGMTGVWKLKDKTQLDQDPEVHEHVRIHLGDGTGFCYVDPRRFGVLDILDLQTGKKRLGHLGPEPLSKEFTGELLWQALCGRTSYIKTAIMDQKLVVGVGNIYASEALHRAGLRPQALANKISKLRVQALVMAIKEVLEESIAAGGSTISDFKNLDSMNGYFQQAFRVYDRAGKNCLKCGVHIRTQVMAGRSTYWCPGCQR